MSQPHKTNVQLIEEANARREAAKQNLSSASYAHAQEIKAGATTMKKAGYGVQVNGRTVIFTGPQPGAWMDDEAAEILDHCPPYALLADFALAYYEQFVG